VQTPARNSRSTSQARGPYEGHKKVVADRFRGPRLRAASTVRQAEASPDQAFDADHNHRRLGFAAADLDVDRGRAAQASHRPPVEAGSRMVARPTGAPDISGSIRARPPAQSALGVSTRRTTLMRVIGKIGGS